jgi:hypothetical protein
MLKKAFAPESTENGLFPEEKADIREEAATLVADVEAWLNTPNDRLGGLKPNDLIGTEQEQHLRDLLRAIKYGMPT